MQPIPSLTAALIVRDEAANLARCLTSVRPHVAEIVVIDTGSTDGTVDIARSFGADVGFFGWVDDFAAARNATLARVKTDWFLSIDADEELELDAPDAFERAFAAPGVAIWGQSRDAAHGAAVKIARIFQMVPGIHWESPIHETIVQPGFEKVPPIDASAAIAFVHHGYGQEDAPAKMARNLRILRKRLGLEPDDYQALFYLARECAQAGEGAEGFEAGTAVLNGADWSGSRLADAFVVTAWNALLLDRHAEVVELTKEARRLNVPTVWSEYMRGVAFVRLGQMAKALEAAERACAMPYPEDSLISLPDIWTAKRFEMRSLILNAERN